MLDRGIGCCERGLVHGDVVHGARLGGLRVLRFKMSTLCGEIFSRGARTGCFSFGLSKLVHYRLTLAYGFSLVCADKAADNVGDFIRVAFAKHRRALKQPVHYRFRAY